MSQAAPLERVLSCLAKNAVDLQRQGVLRAAVFGSVARGEARADSDVDVLVELDSDAGLTLLDYAALQRRLEEIIGEPVDMANRKTLKPLLRQNILDEAVHAF